LHLYAEHPAIQIGVVGLTLARLLEALAGSHAELVSQVVVTAAALPAARLIERTSSRPPSGGRLFAGAVTMILWTQASMLGQFGDCLLLVLLTGAVLAIQRDRGDLAGLAIGLAIATKPWAAPALLMPAVLTHRQRVKALAIALGCSVAAYLPFVLADGDSWSAGRTAFRTSQGTIGGLLGWEVAPSWVRAAQLAIGLALAALAVTRGRYAAVPLVLVVGRLCLEPNDASYYVLGLAFAAWLWDEQRRRGYPSSILVFLYFLVPQDARPGVVVSVKLALLAAIVVSALGPMTRSRAATAATVS
jgi:hypothetical protein